jgi:hypothetical protein
LTLPLARLLAYLMRLPMAVTTLDTVKLVILVPPL